MERAEHEAFGVPDEGFNCLSFDLHNNLVNLVTVSNYPLPAAHLPPARPQSWAGRALDGLSL